MVNKTVALIGTLDTKGEEIDYLKKEVQKQGFKTIVIDVGVLGKPLFKADISREEVAKLGGVNLHNSVLYTTTFPCLLCAKKIVTVGIKKVIYIEPYPMKEARELLENCQIELIKFEGVKSSAFYKLFEGYQRYL